MRRSAVPRANGRSFTCAVTWFLDKDVNTNESSNEKTGTTKLKSEIRRSEDGSQTPLNERGGLELVQRFRQLIHRADLHEH